MNKRQQNSGGSAANPAAGKPAINPAKDASSSMDPARLQRLPLRLFSAENAFAFLVNKIPWMTNVEASFRLTGAMLLCFDPEFFISNLSLELSAFPFSVCSEIWDVIKEKIAFDAVTCIALIVAAQLNS